MATDTFQLILCSGVLTVLHAPAFVPYAFCQMVVWSQRQRAETGCLFKPLANSTSY